MNTLAVIIGAFICLSPIVFLSLGYWMGFNKIKPRVPWFKEKEFDYE